MSVSAHGAGTRGPTHHRSLRGRLRSAPMGTEAGRAWWQERKEAGHHRCCTQASSSTPPSLDQLRSIRAASQHTKGKARSGIVSNKLECTTRNVEFRRLRPWPCPHAINDGVRGRLQKAAPTVTRTPICTERMSRSPRVRMEG
jgi:hypothetical protein